jgi:hypothetical protein
VSLSNLETKQKVHHSGGPFARSNVYSKEALERKRAREREYDKERWNDPEFRRAKADSRHKRLYGISLDERDAMEREQDGKCAICREKKKLVVDHCHTTGKVRGLLCGSCNKALGFLKDDSERIARLLDYLSRSSKSPNGTYVSHSASTSRQGPQGNPPGGFAIPEART